MAYIFSIYLEISCGDASDNKLRNQRRGVEVATKGLDATTLLTELLQLGCIDVRMGEAGNARDFTTLAQYWRDIGEVVHLLHETEGSGLAGGLYFDSVTVAACSAYLASQVNISWNCALRSCIYRLSIYGNLANR